MRRYFILCGFIFSLLRLGASSNEADARQLVENSRQKLSLKNVHLSLNLETTDGKGNSKIKEMKVSFAQFDRLRKVLVEFTAPEKVNGTKILTTDYPDKKGIIEIYMPSTGRIQKFRASQRNLNMLGSEIPINQFSTVAGYKFTFTMLGKGTVNSTPCHKIKMYDPEEKGYGILFISVGKEQILRIEQYDSRDKLVRLTVMSEYMQVNNSGEHIYPKEIRVENRKTGKTSRMTVHQINYIKQIRQEDFSLIPEAS
ncbi:MAG: outer membrane lipoprotein-sorting protein [Mangrovibacterium sp.]